MSHHIDKFSVEKAGNAIRLADGSLNVLLTAEDAGRLAAALRENQKAELVIAGDTGEYFVVSVEPSRTGDRLVSFAVRHYVLGVQAKFLADALEEEARKAD